jgi:hypothetical protein
MTTRREGALKLALKLAVYYAVLAGAAWLLTQRVPQWRALVAALHPVGAAAAALGALALVLPVAWVYMRTKPRARYDPSLVHTLIILPVVIAGIVLIVHDSLALAFSLAGVVAVVRFRNTLRDTKDAVYIFLAIAVGLAGGVGAFAVGFVISLIYVGVALAIWHFDVGSAPLSIERIRGRLLVETTAAEPAQRVIGRVLDEHARRWRAVAAEPRELAFVVQLRRNGSPDGLVTAVQREAAPHVGNVRFEPDTR